MNQDYATQWLKLAGKCFAWIVGISFVGGALLGIAMGIGTHDNSFFLMPLLTVFYACVYSMIPVALFASFIVALRAFGRKL